MDGNAIKVVIDTNIIFMALYDRNSKAGKIIELATENKIQLFSPESVKNELLRVLKREMEFSEDKIILILDSLPVIWVEKEVYENVLDKTKVKHKPDKPIEALSLILGCRVLSADKHFKSKVDINELIRKLEKRGRN